MGLIARYVCDHTNAYGTCATQSLPAHTETEARQQAEQSGWHLRPDGTALCPTHAGTNHLTPRARPIHLH